MRDRGQVLRRVNIAGLLVVTRYVVLRWRALMTPRARRWLRNAAVAILAGVTIACGQTGLIYARAKPHIPAPKLASQGKPHHFDPKSGTRSTLHVPPPISKLPPFTPGKQRPPMAHAFQATMRPGLLALTPGAPARFVGSDGRLEIDVPAGAVNAADIAAAGGKLALRITEIAPASGSNAGGSGVVSFGGYLVEVVDGRGKHVAHGLRKPAALMLHTGSRTSGLDLADAFVVFNGSGPKGIIGRGPYSTQPVTFDGAHNVISAQLPADPSLLFGRGRQALAAGVTPLAAGVTPLSATQSTPSTTFTFDTYPPVAKFGSPDPANVDLNSGSLTEGLKIDVPPGPAGAMPDITLAYNSGAVSEQHSPQGAAGWVGEGWSMSLGSISWAEHNVLPTQNPPYNTWQSTWYLTDPFGTSTELIPPNLSTSTFNDDSTNWYCATQDSRANACPMQFHTARETYAKVYAYVGPSGAGSPTNPPCFRVYLANGVMEEFGCAANALQYYPIQGNTLPGQNNADEDYLVNWMLDLITNPQGDQVHITYEPDTEKAPDGYSYPRDTVMSTIEWDSPTCVNASQMCMVSGSSPNLWQPLYRVSFNANHHTVTRLTNTPANCNTDATVRCDDPVDLYAQLGSGGAHAPLVNGTWVLNDIYVQTRSSGTSQTWNTVRDYQLSYEQSGPTTITDPATGKQISTAGYLDLTRFQEAGTDYQSQTPTTYPATTFAYTPVTEYYEDGSYTPYSTTFCGPSWNAGGNGGTCDLWSQSYDGNSRYISSVSNGQGLQQTVTWANGRSNTHSVNSGGSPADPLYCDSHQTGYPCDEADDQAWSRAVVTGRADTVVQVTQNGQGGAQTSTPVTSQYAYTYQLSYPLKAQECTDCVAGMYWGNQNDGDYLDYYNGHFMGFAQTTVSKPDGSAEVHTYNATEGWGVYDTSKITICPTTLPPPNSTCHASPWWDLANAGHGLETQAWYYDTNGSTLLKKTTSWYTAVCPPSGITATPAYTLGTTTFGPWDGNLVSELDHDNPVATCDVRLAELVNATWDGSGTDITDTEAYTYDTYGRVIQTTRTSNTNNSGSPTEIVDKTGYVWDDGLTVPKPEWANTSQEGLWGGLYLMDLVASSDTEGTGGTQYICQRNSFDGQAYTTGQTSGLTKANPTEQDKYTGCGATPSGKLSTTAAYDSLGNPLSTNDADANAGDTSHVGASGTTCAGTTACRQYDSTTQAKPALDGNVAGQSATTAYATDATGGYGQWPTARNDINAQQWTYAYDALGRFTSMRSPGQSTGPSTEAMAYANWCTGTSAQPPCMEVDTTRRIDSGTTVMTRNFYDGLNRLVETRAPAPGGHDVVRYVLYNAAGQPSTMSAPYFVADYTGPAGAGAFSIPDSQQPVTTMSYDGIGRALLVTDALSNAVQAAYSIVCGVTGFSDTGCYEQTLATDANSHRHSTLSNAFGWDIYDQRYSGNSGANYAVYSSVKTTYDAAGRVTQILHPDGTSRTTYTYDTAGRMTSMSDPDRGSHTYSYDANGNLVQQTDARGQSTYAGFDGLNRPIWRNSTNSATGAYATWSYDDTTNGNMGKGRLTGETFNGGPSSGNLGAGSYAYTYDAQGDQTGWTVNMGGSVYTFGYGYNDAGMPTSLTYSDGEALSYGYDSASGWLTSLATTPSGGSQTNLLTNITYGGSGGAAGNPTGASVANGTYTFGASYDADARLSGLTLTNAGTGATLFSSQRGYDAVGNVTAVNTTIPDGTDVQQFCYDEQNRLTWAGSTGTPTCSGTAIVPGSLTAAEYTQPFAYDQLDRLTSGPLGTYTYGDAAHLHAATAIGSAYTASYDAAGDMTCRAPNAFQTCAGSTPTGGQLTFDNEGRLAGWTSTAQSCLSSHSPITTETFAYDGEGRRVVESANTKDCPSNTGVVSTTYYLGDLEEVNAGTPPTKPLVKYFATPSGLPMAMRAGSTLTYLATDGLGSVTLGVDGSGNETYKALYAPYGEPRYGGGNGPTTKGFTGQRADTAPSGASGLDYYNARYYDPVAGQFLSADTVADGLNRYGYVHANPETFNDPTGHRFACTPDDGCDVGGTGGGNGSGAGGTGPSGGSSGSSGGGTVNCAANPPPKDANCDAYLANVLRDKDARDSALWSLYQEASRYILFGGLAGIAIDLYEVFRPAEGFIQRVFDVYDIVVDAGNVLTYAPAAFGNRGLPDAISRLVSTVNSVASFLKSAVALIRELGEFAEYALDAGWIVAEGVLSGLPGFITWIAESFAGNTILDLLAAGAHAVAAQGFKLLADYQTQENMGLDQWCKAHNSAGCVPLGPSIVPASK